MTPGNSGPKKILRNPLTEWPALIGGLFDLQTQLRFVHLSQ
jgi:hypothetical protein